MNQSRTTDHAAPTRKRIHVYLPVILILLPLLPSAFLGCKGESRGASHGTEKGGLDLVHFIDQISNTAAIAKPPLGRAGLVSSHDTSGGNQDWGNYNVVPASDGLVDVANLQGPGVVRRIWITGQDVHKWHFFFDGETSPRFVAVGTNTSVNASNPLYAFRAPLRGLASGGFYSYTPIPYAKSLRIAVPGDYKPARPYFQINYETFPSGTIVQSFPRKLGSSEQEALVRAGSHWSDANPEFLGRLAAETSRASHTIAPSVSALVFEATGTGTLNSFTLKLSSAAAPMVASKQLRDLALRITYGGTEGASINVPVGDFFFNAFWPRPFTAEHIAFTNGVYICQFPMPTEDGIKVEIQNDGTNPAMIEFGANWGTNRVSERYLHAQWRERRAYETAPGRPVSLMKTNGSGHYIGTYINVVGTDGSWNILEGDDLIIRDGETSGMNGTGLEDYFNGAWYYQCLSDNPFSGLLEKAAMRTGQYRVHGPDKIDFNESLQFSMEFGHELGSPLGGNTSLGYMSGLSLWYQDAPAIIPPLPKRAALPADNLETVTAMTGLIELETQGLFVTARDRALWLAERLPDAANKIIFTARAADYDKILALTAPASAPTYSVSLPACRDLSVFHKTSKALIGMQSVGRSTIYLDGKPLFTNTRNGQFQAKLVDWKQTHQISIQFTRAQSVGRNWVSAGLRLGDKIINLTDENMAFSFRPSAGWPAVKSTPTAWKKPKTSTTFRPTTDSWRVPPNPFVAMQHHPIMLINAYYDPKKAAREIYLTRTLTLER